jgi:serine/threonine protein kinase
VLASFLGTRERERFEREGRLAASLNHAHCVFVFGASEIDGHPVIAMEVMQGTLADQFCHQDINGVEGNWPDKRHVVFSAHAIHADVWVMEDFDPDRP